ncbi:MAG: DUF401 family protein [Proteobacteria bacterium]|nr:DUF401 family protein [Pseudomonadota bacterium]MBU4294495.1 DUF401 family protein [Pseudomonadota bacterium]MCG2747031.1 DUF401 family protein [Desulfobulbaceae bacterium]
MEWLNASLPFIKVLGAFGLILLGIRLRIGLGLSILAGGVAMGFLFYLGPMPLLRVSAVALTREKFLFLAAIVGLILILSDALERSGQSRRLMDALSGYLTSPRLRLVFFPALIGLLPMPGGAVFSAPMVKAVSAEMSLKNEERVVINYWFRHVWELAWPLYPGIILTVALADIPIVTLISRTWPGVIAMFTLGWIFFLRPGVLKSADLVVVPSVAPRSIRVALKEGVPLLVAIVGAVGLEGSLSEWAPAVPFEWGVIAALFVAVVCVMVQNRLGAAFLFDVLTKKSLRTMLFVIAAIFIFKDIMQAAGVVDAMALSAGDGIALFAASVFLPFLVGMVSGINVAFVGATFPLLLGLLDALNLRELMIPYLVLASFAGFTGVMISPIHICFILTCEFFGADLARAWRRLVAPCFCFALTGCLLFWILL